MIRCSVDQPLQELLPPNSGVQSISLAFEHCVLHIAWLARVAKTINFHGYGTPRDQRGGSTDPFRGGP